LHDRDAVGAAVDVRLAFDKRDFDLLMEGFIVVGEAFRDSNGVRFEVLFE
jgi:hypothetical protein